MQVGKSGQTHAILDEYKLDYLPHSKLGSFFSDRYGQCKTTCHKLVLLEAWQRGRGLYRWLGLTLEAHPKCNLDADNILSADFPSQIDFHLGHKIESACVRCPPTRRCVAGDDVRMLWLKSQPIPGRMTETDGVGRQMVFSNLALSENSASKDFLCRARTRSKGIHFSI